MNNQQKEVQRIEKNVEHIIPLLKGKKSISINCDNFYKENESETITIDARDFHWIVPIIKKYGEDGLIAVLSWIAEIFPLEKYISNKFEDILDEIEDLEVDVKSTLYIE